MTVRHATIAETDLKRRSSPQRPVLPKGATGLFSFCDSSFRPSHFHIIQREILWNPAGAGPLPHGMG
jgi:hypothetical protein